MAERTRPGVAYRLYTRHDFEQRRLHEVPEIARLDLAEWRPAAERVFITRDEVKFRLILGGRDAGSFRVVGPERPRELELDEAELRARGAGRPGAQITTRFRVRRWPAGRTSTA